MAIASSAAAAAIVGIIVLAATTATAVPIGNIVFFGPGWGDSVLPACDDCYGTIDLPANLPPLPYINAEFSSIFVSNNGYIQLGVPPPTDEFFDYGGIIQQIPYPVFAPFYANIDTRGKTVNSFFNKVYYGLRTDPTQLSLLRTLVSNYFNVTDDFLYAIVATWYQVGTVNATISPTNSFQAALMTDGIKTFFMTSYVDDEINWSVDGDGNHPMVGAVFPNVGYIFEGLSDWSLLTVDTSQSGTPGRYIYEVSTGFTFADYPISDCEPVPTGGVSCAFRTTIIVPAPYIFAESNKRSAKRSSDRPLGGGGGGSVLLPSPN